MNKKLITTIMACGIIGTSLLCTNNVTKAKNLEDTKIETKENIDSKEVGAFVVTAKSGANIRKGPGTQYSIITSVPKGTVLWRVKANPTNGWYQVETENGRYRGWISSTTGYPK